MPTSCHLLLFLFILILGSRTLTTGFYEDALLYADFGLDLLTLTNSFSDARFVHPNNYCFEYPPTQAHLLPSTRRLVVAIHLPNLLKPINYLTSSDAIPSSRTSTTTTHRFCSTARIRYWVSKIELSITDRVPRTHPSPIHDFRLFLQR